MQYSILNKIKVIYHRIDKATGKEQNNCYKNHWKWNNLVRNIINTSIFLIKIIYLLQIK